MEKILYNACKDGELDIVKELVNITELNWNTKNGDWDGWSPLHVACYNGHVDIVCFLLTLNNVNANIKANVGATPLHYACCRGHLNIVKILCTLSNISVYERNNYGKSPLHWACEYNRFDIVRYLIEVEGADYSIQDNKGSTPKDIASKKGKSMLVKYLENIANDSNFSLSHQTDRRLQRCFEKNTIALLLHQDDAFDLITKSIFETGVLKVDHIKLFTHCIVTIEDFVIICSILKMFIKKGKFTLEESCKMVEQILIDDVFIQKAKCMSRNHVNVLLLLDELKNQCLISKRCYIHSNQKIRIVHVQTTSTMYEKNLNIVANNNMQQVLCKKYEEFYDYYLGFYSACENHLEGEITLALLRIGTSLLRLLPLITDSSVLMDNAMDISDPIKFCRIVFEVVGLIAFMETGSGELVIKPIVKYILERSKIDANEFISVLKCLISKTLQDEDIENGEQAHTIIDAADENHSVSYEKNKIDENSVMDDTISEVSSSPDEEKLVIVKHTNKMDLIDLCKALKGTIDGDDFIDKLTAYQYITALEFSKGNASVFNSIIKYIPPDYNINETAKLCIKRDGSEVIETEITAIQYATICGYVNILEEFFLSKEQVDGIDFGLDNPVSCYVFASKRRMLLLKP